MTDGVRRRRGPFPLRTLHLGTAGEPAGESVYVQYNRVLADREARTAFAEALLHGLREDRRWHEVRLDGFAPEALGPFLHAEPGLRLRRGVCPTADLRGAVGAGGDVLTTMSAATRRKLRRSLRGLGDVETEWAATPGQALDILEELMRLHQARWEHAGRPGAFASPLFAAFHRDLVRRLAAGGRVALFRVRSATGTVGCLYGLVEGARLLSYQGGLASYEDSQIRPGFVAHLLFMQACFDRGLVEYDFLEGETTYKREMTNTRRELLWATWRRPKLRWTALDQLARLRRAARRARRRPP